MIEYRDGVFYLDGEPVSAEEAEAVATTDPDFVAVTEAETLRQEMFTLTDQIIDWVTDAKAYLFGPRWAAGIDPYGAGEIAADDPRVGTPRFGVLDPQAFVALLGTAEGYLLRFKALQVRPQSVTDQRDWMLQRGQEAQSVLALAGLVK